MSLLNLIPQAEAKVDVTAFAEVASPIVTHIVYPLLELLFGLAVLIFVWGVIQLVIHGDDPEARSKGTNTIMYGTLGMFIMVSAWGIIYLVANTVKAI